MKLPEKKISNPLTIIALFAMIAETSGTIVLPFISSDIQLFYMIYLILFPVLLVLLFFITLWTKHHVLYSPDDYNSDDSFIKMSGLTLSQISINDQKQKIIENYIENKEINASVDVGLVKEETALKYGEKIKSTYWIAGNLMQYKLKNRYGHLYKGEIEFNGHNYSYKSDGYFENSKEVKIFEIKYFDIDSIPRQGVSRHFNSFSKLKDDIESKTQKEVSLTVILISNKTGDKLTELELEIKKYFPRNYVYFEFQNFDLLRNEFLLE